MCVKQRFSRHGCAASCTRGRVRIRKQRQSLSALAALRNSTRLKRARSTQRIVACDQFPSLEGNARSVDSFLQVRGLLKTVSVIVHLTSTLTREDENAIARAFLKAVASILDILPVAYVLRIETSDGERYEHSRPCPDTSKYEGPAKAEQPVWR